MQNQTSKNHQWLKNLRWKPRMVWKTRNSSLFQCKNSRKFIFTERFVDRQVSLDVEHGSSGNLVLLKYVSTTTIEHTVDSTDSVFRTL